MTSREFLNYIRKFLRASGFQGTLISVSGKSLRCHGLSLSFHARGVLHGFGRVVTDQWDGLQGLDLDFLKISGPIVFIDKSRFEESPDGQQRHVKGRSGQLTPWSSNNGDTRTSILFSKHPHHVNESTLSLDRYDVHHQLYMEVIQWYQVSHPLLSGAEFTTMITWRPPTTSGCQDLCIGSSLV
ncbi:hypothetical protein TNCV_2125351 [Trichonephila clavipes]|nr:hypothetical protein TNCV_2125351 [Trichonephila clavipes]